MKAMSLVVLVVAFILAGLWFVTSQINEHSQENLKKELVDKKEAKRKLQYGKADYIELTKRNNKIQEQQKKIKELARQNIVTKRENTYTEQTIGPSIDQLLDDDKIAAIDQPEVVDNVIDNLDQTVEENYTFIITDWKLAGTKKNVLMVSFKIKNNSQLDIHEKIKVICSTFNEEGDFAGTKKSRYSIHLEPGEEKIFENEIFGTVDTDSKDIKCLIEKKQKLAKVKEEIEPKSDEEIIKLLEE